MDVNPETTPRRLWPPEALRRTYEEMQKDSPADIISRELLLSSLHPSQHFARCVAYTASVALNSVMGHLIGLGDRHLDNLLLDLATGEVVHVDYSICFDRGQRLRVPERVPFRLTRCMVSALGPMGVSGLFLQTMEVGLGLLRDWRELLLSLVEPCFLLAPVNDWVHPIATPFRPGQAAGVVVRRLCKELQGGLAAAQVDAAQVAENLGRFASQCGVVYEVQSRHAGLKALLGGPRKSGAERELGGTGRWAIPPWVSEAPGSSSRMLGAIFHSMGRTLTQPAGRTCLPRDFC